jgi:hypothetical protein
MEFFWGDGLGEETQGLDILGIRGLDQSLEIALANGITTISLRGRYFTILPWLIGEFFEAEKSAGATTFAMERLRNFIGRVEYLTLACTVTDISGGDGSGALGSVNYREAMAKLRSGAAIPFPKDRGGSILGTYFGPCRALGLVRTADSGESPPFLLTPRGTKIWQVRKAALGDGALRQMLWNADALTPDNVRAAVPHFSLIGLRGAAAEAACLREALETPWTPAGNGTSVAKAYEKFAGTLAWLRKEAKSHPLQAGALLADNYRRVLSVREGNDDTTTAWAEFEWRRRLHFALELMLSAICITLNELGEASLSEVVRQWRETPELPAVLTDAWPEVTDAWMKSGAEMVASAPLGAMLDMPPAETLNSMSPHAKGIAAFGLIASLAHQTQALRAAQSFRDRKGAGERAIALVEAAGPEPFEQSLMRLGEIVTEAHLATTFRKMAGGQKCSLRFFPDGQRLCSTGLSVGAGQSGTRLSNVIRVLADAGVDGIAEAA